MTAAHPRPSARERAHQTLRRQILNLELPPGSSLSENELAAALSLSRTPVRESLILLAEEGLVQVLPQIGSFVARVDLQRVADAQFVREAVELASLVDAKDRLTPADIRLLRSILAQQLERADDLDAFFALDELFHQTLLSIGGHGNAWQAVASAKGHLDRARRLSIRQTHPVRLLIDQHTAVVDMLEAGDLDAAVEALRTHLRAVFADVQHIKEMQPELFAEPDAKDSPRRNGPWI